MTTPSLSKDAETPGCVLIANRGEIALRIIRGLRTLGYTTVAVYSSVDAQSPHVAAAHQAVYIGEATPTESYLRMDNILAACQKTGANFVHPGYGFLSENADFAEAAEAAGIIFIGPSSTSIRNMGDKTAALAIAKESKVPTIPSFLPNGENEATHDQLIAEAQKIGLPVIIKAAAGGGGKGMRIAHTEAELEEQVPAAVREATNAFGDGRIFLERYLSNARHVEVQVFGDGQGLGAVIGERDCSIQRRHQKLIEECPAPNLPQITREKMHAAALNLVEKTHYRGAGTVEFILSNSGEFFFLEMNTRLQVEHPVTELVHGVDLLALQMEVACGRGLAALPKHSTLQGHAIEVRIYAENPATGFLPSIGKLTEVVWPTGPGIRVDAGVERGNEVTMHYDPMLAKIIAHGQNRDQAIARMRQALAQTFIAGVESTIPFCLELLARDDFANVDICTTFIADKMPNWKPQENESPWLQAAKALAPRLKNAAALVTGEQQAPAVWESLSDWRMQ